MWKWIVKVLTEFDRHQENIERKNREEYLNQSSSIYDLECRMREMERPHQGFDHRY